MSVDKSKVIHTSRPPAFLELRVPLDTIVLVNAGGLREFVLSRPDPTEFSF